MSADNIIYVIPFKRQDGVIVHRVCEVRLSGVEYELLDCMKKGNYKEFEGTNSYNRAQGAALIMEREAYIVEYGISNYVEDGYIDLNYFEEQVRQLEHPLYPSA